MFQFLLRQKFVSRAMSLIAGTCFLFACQSVPPAVAVDYQPLLNDKLFEGYQSVTIETEQDVFAIDDDMKNFVRNVVSSHDEAKVQLRKLSKSIFEHSDVLLQYQNNANTTASETFRNGAANCLSLTIMTYTLADFAGFSVDFQHVKTPELWVRRDNTTLMNRHINLNIYQNNIDRIVIFGSYEYEVDFNQTAMSGRFPREKITKQTVLSMFYNNKGVDALIEKDYRRAYAYLRQAVLTQPKLLDSYTNLGVLYSRIGEDTLAEKSYTQALVIDANDGTSLENLATLYERTGRAALAEEIKETLERRRKENPYFHFILGEEAADKGRYVEALEHYEQAIRLQRNIHEFYFAMAKTLYLMGKPEASKRYMALAKKYTTFKQDRLVYQQKIDSYSLLTPSVQDD